MLRDFVHFLEIDEIEEIELEIEVVTLKNEVRFGKFSELFTKSNGFTTYETEYSRWWL